MDIDNIEKRRERRVSEEVVGSRACALFTLYFTGASAMCTGNSNSNSNTSDKKAKIHLVGSEVALIFDVQDIALVREHGVVGVLTGTLAGAPQQNVFLGVPLRLMMEEAVWLVEQGVAAIVSGTGEGVAERLSGVRAEQWAEWERGAALERGAQLAWKREQLAQKKPERAVTERDEALMQQSVFVHTRDTPRAVPSGVPRDAESTAESTADPGNSAAIDVTALLKRDNRLRANYGVYRSLRAKGYVLSPGARFGGRYVAYPGDPLRYHSHLIVQEAMDKKQEIDLLSMVNGARLGTSVKKTWVLAGAEAEAEAEAETEFYSVEWAGFG